MTKILELYTATVEWKNTTVKAESALKPYEDPVLKPDELKQKIVALNREVQYLLNKAKTAKPKKPKTDKKKTEKKANDTTTIPPVDKTEKSGEADATQEPSDEEVPPPPPPTEDEASTTEKKTPDSEDDSATEAPEVQEPAPDTDADDSKQDTRPDEENHQEL